MAKQVRVTDAQWAEKWGRRLKGATQDIRNGVERVTESPMELAAAKQDKMLANVTEAVRSGKWARGLRRRTLAEWKDRVLNIGVGRIPAGVDAAEGDVREFARDLIDHQNAGLGRIDAMPDVTVEDGIARAAAWIRHMAEFERS